MLRGILQSYWESLSKNAERCYRRSANTRFAKILRGVLQKYKEVFCKNIESCSANLLRGVLRSYPLLSLFVTIFGNPLPPGDVIFEWSNTRINWSDNVQYFLVFYVEKTTNLSNLPKTESEQDCIHYHICS